MYLRHSLKDGSAKGVIDGLSRSGEYYAEAVKSLKRRYDYPRLINQTHVPMILEAAPLKEGGGKELRCLHKTAAAPEGLESDGLRTFQSIHYINT